LPRRIATTEMSWPGTNGRTAPVTLTRWPRIT
jgi:hypothetical protein